MAFIMPWTFSPCQPPLQRGPGRGHLCLLLLATYWLCALLWGQLGMPKDLRSPQHLVLPPQEMLWALVARALHMLSAGF